MIRLLVTRVKNVLAPKTKQSLAIHTPGISVDTTFSGISSLTLYTHICAMGQQGRSRQPHLPLPHNSPLPTAVADAPREGGEGLTEMVTGQGE